MILVIGATGFVGGEICYLLATKGLPFRAMVRQTSDSRRVERLMSYGAVLVQGDLREMVSLQAACRGARAVICTASSVPFSYQPGSNDIRVVDLEGVERLIEAALAAGVRHFIYISCALNEAFDDPLRNARRHVEQHLIASGVPYTILRPGFLMEAWLSSALGFDPVNARAEIYGTGDQPIRWISSRDVARYAVASLENPYAMGVIRTLDGPEPINPHQVIGLFEQESRQIFEVTRVPVELLQKQFKDAADPLQKSLAGLKIGYATGDPADRQSAQPAFMTRLRTVGEYVRIVLGTSRK